MDHHCIWIDNCVGVKNHKLFIVFLLYGVTFIMVTMLFLIIGFAL